MNLTFNSIIKILRLFEENDEFKIEKSCKILGLQKNNIEVLDMIFKYVLESSNNSNEKRIFDYDLDFKYYYADFKEYGIDLLEEEIDWFKFSSILKKIMLNNNSLLSKIIEFRTYEKPISNYKIAEAKIHREKLKLKNEYSLPQRQQNIDEGFEKMWAYLSSKTNGGVNNE